MDKDVCELENMGRPTLVIIFTSVNIHQVALIIKGHIMYKHIKDLAKM